MVQKYIIYIPYASETHVIFASSLREAKVRAVELKNKHENAFPRVSAMIGKVVASVGG